jgi:hypothetical protein
MCFLKNIERRRLEFFLKKEPLHDVEDFLRLYMIQTKKFNPFNFNSLSKNLREKYISMYILTNDLEVLVSRIISGRYKNSENYENGMDVLHMKAQIFTLLCLAYYLYRHIYVIHKNNNLYKILEYQLEKLNGFIKKMDFISLSEIDKNYLLFCIRWIPYCKFILNQNTYEYIDDINSKINKIFFELKINNFELNKDRFNFNKLKLNLSVADFL